MQRALCLVFVLLVLAAAACSPTQTFGTVDGMRCSNFGDEVCSQESGFPRARCDFDSTWHILEHCGAATCIVENLSGGQHRTRCGNSPSTGGGRRVVDANGGPQDASEDVDIAAGNPWDAAVEPKKDVAAPTLVACGGYSCDGKEMCTFVGTCESKACPATCTHGQRCIFGTCQTHCYGTCASTEFCKFATDSKSADECSKLGCTPPLDLGTAVAAVELLLPSTPTAACAHLKAATLPLNKTLAGVQITATDLEAGIKYGQETLAFADLGGLADVAMVARETNGKACDGKTPCGLVLSKGENLHPSVTAVPGACKLRWNADAKGRYAQLPVPLRLGLLRVPLVVRDAQVDIASDLKSAEVCGVVTQADLDAALSGLSSTSGPGFQLKQVALTSAGKADIDTDGDGKLDARSVALTFKLQSAILTKWSP